MQGQITCSVDGCDLKHKAQGFCRLHYERSRNPGRRCATCDSRCEDGRATQCHACAPPDQSSRVCQGCYERKAADKFYRTSRGTRLMSYCRECHVMRSTLYRQAKPAEARARHRKWQASRSPEQRRKAYLRKKYGLPIEQFDAMLATNDGRCEICLKPVVVGGGSAHWDTAAVDHCHTTGKVRGILCRRCNLAIEFLLPDDAIERARQYLARHAPPDTH